MTEVQHDEILVSDRVSTFLEHHGVKGQRWGVRKDERALSDKDKALNISQRSQVKVASSISALAAIGMSTNAAATLFQLQNRIEHYKIAKALLDQAQSNPFIDDAGREAIRRTKNQIVQGIIGSAMATTAVTIAIGVVTQRTAKAYFAPLHKVYGDSKGKINSDLKQLSKDIKSGKRPHLTVTQYNQEVASIVQKHMTADRKNLLYPFHELARNQLGTNYNTEQMKIRFEKLPNTDLYDKMTIMTPHGLKLVKAIKRVEHSALDEDDLVGEVDFIFDYKFDFDGYIQEWSCPTIEVANDMLEGRFDVDEVTAKFGSPGQGDISELVHSLKMDSGDDFVAHAKERTIQDILDEATPAQQDTVQIVVGAAIENEDLAEFPEIVAAYDALPIEMKHLINFVVGTALGHDEFLHSANLLVGDFLEHHGVKGQRWGVRKAESEGRADRSGGTDDRLSRSPFNNPLDRALARAAVKTGQANLLAAHVAALKSTGHRTLNGVLGDKTFWQRTAIVAGVTLGGVVAANAIPALLPAGVLSSVGAWTAGNMGLHVVAGQAVSLTSTSGIQSIAVIALGKAALTAAGVAVSTTAGVATTAGNYVDNAVRAVRGNTRIDNSARALGQHLIDRQTAGNARTRKILSRNGGLSKKDITPEKPAGSRRGVGEELALMGAGALAGRLAQSDDLESFSLIGESDILDNFLVHQGLDRENVLQTDVQLVEDFIEHHGIKGMRWGVRRPDGADGTVSGGPKAAAKPTADLDKDGKPDHIAIDAVRFAESREKSLHEMSTKELKEANARAQAIKQYNEMFTPGSQQNSALQQRVNDLKLQKEYRNLQAELAPPSKIQGFIKTAQTGYAGFSAVDKMMGGQLSAGLTKKLGLVDPPSAHDLKKLQLDDLKLTKDIVVAKGELNEVSALSRHIADPASLAVGYPYAGKRSSVNNGGARKIGTFNAQSLGNQGPSLPSKGSGYKINKDGSFEKTSIPTPKTPKGSRLGLPKSGDGYKINRDGSFQPTGRHKSGKHKK